MLCETARSRRWVQQGQRRWARCPTKVKDAVRDSEVKTLGTARSKTLGEMPYKGQRRCARQRGQDAGHSKVKDAGRDALQRSKTLCETARSRRWAQRGQRRCARQR